MSAAIQSAFYPFVCVLSLAVFPYQPEQDPRVIPSDLLASAPAFQCPVTTS